MKIMFFAHDPGGANAISPLVEPLKENNELFIFAKGPALTKLPNSIEYNDNLAKIKPDLIITGTSANDFTEKHLWQEAKKLNIKSLAILDHWVNYGIRFSKYGLADIDKFDKICEFLPDYIIVMDEFAKSEMVKDGVPENIILPFGNPHFKDILEKSKNIKNIRNQFATPDEILITFASEPYIEDYGHGEEKTVLKDLISITKDKNAKIVVKLHPKEDFSKYKEFESEKIILNKDTTPAEIIKASDIIISMTSMFLIEAMILGKKCISYQPEQNDENKFILTKKDDLPFINNFEDFSKELIKILNIKESSSYNNFVNLNAKEKIIEFIKKWMKNG